MKLENAKKYFAFALKSGSVVFGTDNIFGKRALSLIMFCETLSENAKQKLVAIATKRKCEYLEVSEENFLEIVKNASVKAFAITNAEIAKAMII